MTDSPSAPPGATKPVESDAAAQGPPRPGRWRSLAGWAFVAFLVAFLIYNAGWKQFLSYLILGLPQGGIIAMIAMGYSMVYGIIQLINFAHGEVFMLSAFLTLALMAPAAFAGPEWLAALYAFAAIMGACSAVTAWAVLEAPIPGRLPRAGLAVAAAVLVGVALATVFRTGLSFWLALAVAALLMPTVGVTLDRVAYRPVRNAPRLIPLITAIGLSLFLMNLAQLLFGVQEKRIEDEKIPSILTPFFPVWGEPGPADMGFVEAIVKTRTVYFAEGLSFPLLDLVIVGLALAMMVGVNAFVHGTKTGAAMRACALDRTTAKLVGIDVDRTVAITFAIGSFLAAVAAPFYVIKYVPISPTMGYLVGILAFSSAVLGGIGNIRGAMLGGFLIGIVLNMVPMLEVTDDWPFFKWLATWPMFAHVENWNLLEGISEWRLGIAYFFMILIILLKPSGLLGQAAAARRA